MNDPDKAFSRKVDGGKFALDGEQMTVTDHDGHTAEFPAAAVGELKDAVDAASARQDDTSEWFDPEDVSALLRRGAEQER